MNLVDNMMIDLSMNGCKSESGNECCCGNDG